MGYPNTEKVDKLMRLFSEYTQMKHEYGAAGIEDIIGQTGDYLRLQLDKLQALPDDSALAAKEPNDLAAIRALRNPAPRALWTSFDEQTYKKRLKGALFGRYAGCTLGAPVENWSVDAMESWAKWVGDEFPKTDYWSAVKGADSHRGGPIYGYSFTPSRMDGVPMDDDVVYTLLGLLIAEEYGLDFTTKDVGEAWVKYLPMAYTAERVALDNLKNGVPFDKCGEIDNPFAQWIGADIRSDPMGYLCPGLPERAAEYAYRDAYISHRRNGIYGEMFFSAAIAAAFAMKNPIDALQAALNEIPRECALYGDIVWALETGKKIKDFREGREAVDKRFEGMNRIHTNNNAALVVFGLMLGGEDFSRTIGLTVSMGLDNDCTGATAGSLFGAAYGIDAIPEKWYKNFNNKVYSYINGHEMFALDDVLERFLKLAKKQF